MSSWPERTAPGISQLASGVNRATYASTSSPSASRATMAIRLRIASSSSAADTAGEGIRAPSGELREPPGGAGQQLVGHAIELGQVASSGQWIERQDVPHECRIASEGGLDGELLGGDVAAQQLG